MRSAANQFGKVCAVKLADSESGILRPDYILQIDQSMIISPEDLGKTD